MKQRGNDVCRRPVSTIIQLAATVLILMAFSVAQDGLTIRNDTKQVSPSVEASKIYLSACAAVQREFGSTRELRPRVILVLGIDKQKEGLDVDSRQIRLAKWNPFMFAQGVVMLAFEELMPEAQVLVVAKRAVEWSEATVDLGQIAK